MSKRMLLLLCNLMLSCPAIYAQQMDATLSVYQNQFQQEKLHLHFDKTVYSKGETIWYKAYLMAGDSLSDYSRNFYVDWYDQSGLLIKHTINPIFESTARGAFEVPANYVGEVLHLKAYTRWMLNFETDFLYNKEIQVVATDKNSQPKTIKPIASIHFFPEGGDMIQGIESKIAFIASDQTGKPVAIRGALFNAANQFIDSLMSVHDGMGSFQLNPLFNEMYTCNWVDEFGINHSSPLPIVKKTGIALSAQQIEGHTKFGITRTIDATENLKSIHVIATMNQQLLYQANINLTNKRSVLGDIPTEDFKTGILQITLFDKNWIPMAERILFINNQRHQFFPEIHSLTTRVGKRGKNILEIFVPDSLLSNLSVSITDANLYHDNSTNIFTDLLISSDIKGVVYQPDYYFSSKAESADGHLDLVMLTHGWRKYHWEDIVKGKLPELKFPMDSDYVQIKGKIIAGNDANVKAGQSLSLIMQSKDSSKQYFVLPLKEDGSFSQRGIIFFDTAKIFYQLNGIKNMRNNITASFQYGLPLFPFPEKVNLPAKTLADSAQLSQDNFFYTKITKTKKDFDTVVILKEVVVQTKAKSPTEIMDEKYTTGLFTNKNGYAFDVMTDERFKGQLDIFHYLQNMVPGLSMSLPVLGQNGAEDANSNNTPGLTWRDGTPDYFLNEMPSNADAIMALQMSDVAYIKVYKPPFMASAGSGASGAIAIYTKKGFDMNTDRVKGLNSVTLSGYTAFKEFYHPDYTYSQAKNPDLRATLYWNPYVLTDKKNKSFKLDFFNNDITQKFRIVVEGINAAGKLARVEKIIE